MSTSKLTPIMERWPNVFGEELSGVGIELFDDDAPMLERCLAARDRTELDQHLAAVSPDETTR